MIMKSFVEYLVESKKTYAFKVKVAGELPEGFEGMLKTAMERFSVATMSKGKSTPITETPLEFPQLKNTHVTTFDLEVHYPTTTQVLEAYICQTCKCTADRCKVVTANQVAEQHQEEANRKEAENKPLIGQCDPPPSNYQDLVGSKKVSSFLKDLAAEAKTRAVEGQPTEKASPMPEPGASISPIGSKAQKGK
jgi:hypothetical protein